MNSVRVATVCVDCNAGQTEDNLQKIAGWCSRASANRAQLVLFPELSITGFIPNHPTANHELWLREALVAARRIAEPVPGPSVDRLIEIATMYGIYISGGMLEDAGNKLYNTQVLVGPEGLVGAWRKMHVPMFEMPFYNGGQRPAIAETPFGRIGANICFDALIPESTRLLAVQNVEIVLFPFASDPAPGTPEAWTAWAGPPLRARCIENGVFGMACNYVGHLAFTGVEQQFPGGGMIIGPRGELLAQSNGTTGQPQMILANLQCDTLLEARAEPDYLFRFRRPELYGSLAK